MSLQDRGSFERIEGRFHDGMGSYAELVLANELIHQSGGTQALFDTSAYEKKMTDAIGELDAGDSRIARYHREIQNVRDAARAGAASLLGQSHPARLTRVVHTSQGWRTGSAGDVLLEYAGHPSQPLSVKTDKSGKAAVFEGQTPNILNKWATRYFRSTQIEFIQMYRELGYSSETELRLHYLHVARLVAEVLIRQLHLEHCQPNDFTSARPTEMTGVRYLLRQLLRYKRGTDEARIIVLDRLTGQVKWQSNLDALDIDEISVDDISFRPAKPRLGRPIGSEFCLKVEGKPIVTFQVKHKRGKSRGTPAASQFSDITTRLII